MNPLDLKRQQLDTKVTKLSVGRKKKMALKDDYQRELDALYHYVKPNKIQTVMSLESISRKAILSSAVNNKKKELALDVTRLDDELMKLDEEILALNVRIKALDNALAKEAKQLRLSYEKQDERHIEQWQRRRYVTIK